MSIRTKIALLMTVLLAIISIAVYRYFPARMRAQIVSAVEQKEAAITAMTAFSVADLSWTLSCSARTRMFI